MTDPYDAPLSALRNRVDELGFLIAVWERRCEPRWLMPTGRSPGVGLLLAAVLGMLLTVIEALGRRMRQRNAAPKSPDLTPRAAPRSHDGVGGRIRPARQRVDHKAGRPSRAGTRDNDSCRG